MAIVSYTLDEIKKMRGKTDWKRLRRMKDEDIDYSDIPASTPEQLKNFHRVNPVGRPKSKNPMKGVYIRLPKSTVEALRAGGRGWQAKFRENIDKMIKMGMF